MKIQRTQNLMVPPHFYRHLYRDFYEAGVTGWMIRPVKDDANMLQFEIEPIQEMIQEQEQPKLPKAKRIAAGPPLSSRLCYLRRKRQVRQADVAKWAGVPCSSLSTVERGERKSWLAMRNELARFYQVSAVQLFDEDGWARPIDDAWLNEQEHV